MAYNPALDGLRGIAVLLVVAFHCEVPRFTGGFLGVDIFFVLSGYLITGLLAGERSRTGAIDIGRFYWNRFWRLTPPLLAMLACVALAGVASATDLVVAALYLGDVYYPAIGPWGALSPLRHVWSLAVEEHFYLLWPLLLPLVLHSRRPARVLFLLFLLATAWRVATLPLGPAETTYFRFDARLSGLILGSALALWNPPPLDETSLARIQLYGPALIAAAVPLFGIYAPASLVLAVPVVEIATAGIILAAGIRSSRLHRRLGWPPLVRIGQWSYAIYLWHFPIAWTLRQDQHWNVTLAVTLGLSIPLAIATRRFIELPARALRKETSGGATATAAR